MFDAIAVSWFKSISYTLKNEYNHKTLLVYYRMRWLLGEEKHPRLLDTSLST